MPPLPFTTFPSPPDRHPFSMAPPSYHPDAVTVTLRSTRPTTFQTRNIILRPDEPVNVGRSSRSEAKNLSATPDNALFDCPVISRRHAELELKVNKWTEEKHTIFIKDTGSMHGTSINGQKLVPTRPFQLKEGDTIRLGESVNRADNNYDGVTVTLHCISTATKKNTAQTKSTQQGISVPSDSESDFDDDDDSDGGADLHPSSVHTTPDQGNVKSGLQPLQPSAQDGSSRANFITVEDDEDDEPVPFLTRRVPGQSAFTTNTDSVDSLSIGRVPARPAFIPDTYADESVMAVDSHAAPAPYSSLPFGESDAALEESEDVKASMAVAETAPNDDEGLDHEDVNSEDGEDARSHAWSDDNHFSDEGQESDEHSESHGEFERHSFLSEELYMSDDIAVEDDEDDEGPEIMSSKRRISNDLRALGEEPDHAVSEPSRDLFIAPRPHYDPVRGFQVPSAPSVDKIPTHRSYGKFSGNPFHDMFADSGHSNKWDVGPVQMGPAPTLEEPELHNYSYVSESYQQHMPIMSSMMASLYDPTPTKFDEPLPFGESNASSVFPLGPPSSLYSARPDAERVPDLVRSGYVFLHESESNNKKRKALEISTLDEPVTTAHAPTSSEAIETANVADASTNTVTTTAVPAESQPKRRKIKQAHSQKSMLRTAVIEAGKYTAGAIIGGIGLVTILASPIGEALASC
ncbi:hypothetical protein MBLNU13_g08063t1 [Cladosporium sp. NU13]